MVGKMHSIMNLGHSQVVTASDFDSDIRCFEYTCPSQLRGLDSCCIHAIKAYEMFDGIIIKNNRQFKLRWGVLGLLPGLFRCVRIDFYEWLERCLKTLTRRDCLIGNDDRL